MLNDRLNLESHFSLSHTTNNFVDTARVNHDFEGNIYPSPNGQGETGDVPHNSNDKDWKSMNVSILITSCPPITV